MVCGEPAGNHQQQLWKNSLPLPPYLHYECGGDYVPGVHWPERYDKNNVQRPEYNAQDSDWMTFLYQLSDPHRHR